MIQTKTNLYDINVYCCDGVLSLIAYQVERDELGNLLYTHDPTALNLAMEEGLHEEIAYALDCDNWQEYGVGYWNGHDDWRDITWLKQGDTPAMIKEWVDSLPIYTIERAET